MDNFPGLNPASEYSSTAIRPPAGADQAPQIAVNMGTHDYYPGYPMSLKPRVLYLLRMGKIARKGDKWWNCKLEITSA